MTHTTASKTAYLIPIIISALTGFTLSTLVSSTSITTKLKNWIRPLLSKFHTTQSSSFTPLHGTTTHSVQSKDLLNLLYSIAEDQARKEGFVHRGITCNHCNTSPIRGIRFKCSNCVDFDLCENCEALDLHSKTHVFIKIRVPIPPLANPRTALLHPFYPGTYEFEPTLSAETLTDLQSTTHFDRLELIALYDQYLSLANSDMGIPRSIYDQSLGPLGLEKNLITDRIFLFFDENNDKCISFKEFVCGLSILCKGTLDEKIKATFNGYDLDGDGFITRQELHSMFKAYFHLSMELVRDVVKAMEEEMLSAFDENTGKPVSASFTAPIPASSIQTTSDPLSTASLHDQKLSKNHGVQDTNTLSPSSPSLSATSSCCSSNSCRSNIGDDQLLNPTLDPLVIPPILPLSNTFSPLPNEGSRTLIRQFTPTTGSPLPSNFSYSSERSRATHHDRLQPVMEQMSQEAIAEMVDKVFCAMDTQGTGLIAFDAFKAFVEVDPTLITWFETLGSVF